MRWSSDRVRYLHLVMFAVAFSRSGQVRAQSDIDTREKSALAACDSGRVQNGIEILGALWAQTLDPTYVYNQGRCYQKNGMAAEAVGRFREFLRLASDRPFDNPDLVTRAQRFEKELESELSAQTGGKPQLPPPERARLSEPPHLDVQAFRPAPAAGVGETRSNQIDPANWRRTGGYILIATGMAGAVSGGLLAWTSASQASQAKERFVNAQTGTAWDTAKADFETARDRNRFGWGVTVAGAALLVGGVVFVGTAPESHLAVRATLSPWLGTCAAGIALGVIR